MNDLVVVMPVYNEATCIQDVARAWLAMLERLAIGHTLLIINDGSRDDTAARLAALSGTPNLRVINKPNEGHGPTILQGYRLACADSEWVFQTDSDDEIAPDAFPEFWSQRASADVLLGERIGRVQSGGRRLLSAGSRLLVRLLCGHPPGDANVPFRLMRTACLAPLLECIPPDTFAPNVALTGLAVARRLRIRRLPVRHIERRTGRSSLVSWRLIQVAGQSLIQVGRILWRQGRKP
jgi:glycosyltransferase involved in cell wall biosynthesis